MEFATVKKVVVRILNVRFDFCMENIVITTFILQFIKGYC